MKTRLRISMVVLAAIAVVAVSVASFACGGTSASSNRADNGVSPPFSACPHTGACGMSQCPYMKQLKEQGASNAMQMTCGSQTSKTYYCANVIDIANGRMQAVCYGKVFEVGYDTPYADVGDARYYFSDDCSAKAFADNPSATTSELDREAVALATVDGNVVSHDNGITLARCVNSGNIFLVTAESTVKVMDGKRYYFDGPVELSTLSSGMHK